MNVDILEEKPLNSWWLSCSIPLLIRFMFPGCFTTLNYWVLRILVIISFRGWDPWDLRRFTIENQRRKSKNPVWQALGGHDCQIPLRKPFSDKAWRASPASVPHDILYPLGSGSPRLSERQGHLEIPFSLILFYEFLSDAPWIRSLLQHPKVHLNIMKSSINIRSWSFNP